MTTQTSTLSDSSATTSNAPIVIASCCLALICALVIGVGLASHLVLRHLVQTLPVWGAVLLGFRRSRATGWIALPCLIFWLFLMAVIWTYLLGWTHWISGHFSVTEILMTIVVAAASVLGITTFLAFRSSLSPWVAAALFVVTGAMQWICFRLSLLPAIAHR